MIVSEREMLITIIFFLTVPPYGNITIKSSFGQHDIERQSATLPMLSGDFGRENTAVTKMDSSQKRNVRNTTH